MRVLVVEDNVTLAKSIARVLKQENFSVDILADGIEAEEFCLMNHGDLDLIILDVQLPGMNGFLICQSLREHDINTPVLMLTAKGSTKDKVYGLRIGADDYLVKPFNFDELLARVHALLRRRGIYNKEIIKITENIIFDGGTRTVKFGKEDVALTPKEFEILEYLVQHKNKAVSQQEIFDHCFDFAKENWSNTIEVHVKNLRKKLADYDKTILKTIREFGYRLDVK